MLSSSSSAPVSRDDRKAQTASRLKLAELTKPLKKQQQQAEQALEAARRGLRLNRRRALAELAARHDGLKAAAEEADLAKRAQSTPEIGLAGVVCGGEPPI